MLQEKKKTRKRVWVCMFTLKWEENQPREKKYINPLFGEKLSF